MSSKISMAAAVPNLTSTKGAYPHKSIAELKQTAFMFNLLNSQMGKMGQSVMKWAIKAGLPVKPLIKATIYKHFVGGETLDDCLKVVQKLNEHGVKSLLDYSEEAQESEAGWKHAFEELRGNILFAAGHEAIPFSAFKPTAIGPTRLLEKKAAGQVFTGVEEAQWSLFRERFHALCQAAAQNNVLLMVDAEESWIQKPIDELTREAMSRHNRNRVVVINTYQLYRKDRLATLKADFEKARQGGYQLGAKIVRGAYQEKERLRARELKYASPIQDTKPDTDRDYNEALTFCLEHLNEMLLVVATHNEVSTRMAVDFVVNNNLPPNYPHLWFSQLYGMSDHLSFNLASSGFNVVKYVPYGPVKSVTPYLIRRAEENSSVEGQAMKELDLIKKEIARRQMSGGR